MTEVSVRQPTTEISVLPYAIPAATLGPENPLPFFRSDDPDLHPLLDDNVPDDFRKYIGWQNAFRALPYRMQDNYNRDKAVRSIKSIVLENSYLKVVILPELGGRLASIIHKPTNTQLVEPVTQFQPANLAIRNAWFSTGIEWNVSHFGHHYLTCVPVFAALVTGIDCEPCLRLYAWDRIKCFPYQIDFHLPSQSRFLFVRVRIVNTNDCEIPMYWWSNAAVPQSKDRRVLAPASRALHNSCIGGLGLTDVPNGVGYDMSYSTSSPFSKEFYFDIQPQQRPWIASVDGSGLGLVQTSTRRLSGRKLFVFGMNQGGMRWQEYLNSPGQEYVEIQAGLTRSQVESLPMPAGDEWSWTEAYGMIDVDPDLAHSKDWEVATGAVDSWLDKYIPSDYLEDMEQRFSLVSNREPDEILSQGEGWGALEKMRGGYMPSGLVFDDSTIGEDQKPWLTLLETGVLPEKCPDMNPGQYMVQQFWHDLLEKSIADGKSDHWLGWYHLGVMRMERGDKNGAVIAWKTSIQRTPTSWALWAIAMLEIRNENKEKACELLAEAWETGPKIVQIALEYGNILLELSRYKELRQLIESLPQEQKEHERMRILLGMLALDSGDYDYVEKLLEGDFATIKEGELTLTDLWFGLHERRIAAAEGIGIDDDLKRRVRNDFPPPSRIDFRMANDVI